MSTDPYTHGHHDSVLRSHRWRTAENSAGYLLSSLERGMSLLDVGCGPGTITADLAALVAPGRVVGIDPSEEVIAEAIATHAERAHRVEWAVADVYDLPFESNQFDVVHAHQVLQHLTDPVGALEQMKRVAKPGGIVAIRDADYGSFAWYPENPGLETWGALYSRVARASGGEPNGGRHLVAWAKQAGFTQITATVTAWCYATAEERQWWSGVWEERVTSSRFAERALELDSCTTEDLEEIARAWRAWGDDPDGWFSLPSGEILCVVPDDED